MDRRHFLAALAAAGAAPKLKISAVEMWRLEGRRQAVTGVDRQHQVNPLHVYDELRPAPYRDSPNPVQRETGASALYLKIKTDQGLGRPLRPHRPRSRRGGRCSSCGRS